jgi:hypothetical protein
MNKMIWPDTEDIRNRGNRWQEIERKYCRKVDENGGFLSFDPYNTETILKKEEDVFCSIQSLF